MTGTTNTKKMEEHVFNEGESQRDHQDSRSVWPTPDAFIESIDPGLLTYKEELYQLSVTSMETLRFLRPHEVLRMDIPRIFQRLLIDKIINLQTPNTKKKLKTEDYDHDVRSSRPKQLRFSTDNSDRSGNENEHVAVETTRKIADSGNRDVSWLAKELSRLEDERDSLTILHLHKKSDLSDMRKIPEALKPLPIPGGILTKTICDRCHHRGHKANGNRGNTSCPYEMCVGYSYCGILAKHKDYKQGITEAEKELGTLDKDLKLNAEKVNNIKGFLESNTTNFVKSVKPKLQALFPSRYGGKDGNQRLQRDLRIMKVATKGKIPENLISMTGFDIDALISAGHTVCKTNTFSVKDSGDDDEKRSTPQTSSPISSSLRSPVTMPSNSPWLPNQYAGSLPYSTGSPLLPCQQETAYLGTQSYLWPNMFSSPAPSTSMYPYGMPWWYQHNAGSSTSTITKPLPEQDQAIFPPLPIDTPPSPRPPSPIDGPK